MPKLIHHSPLGALEIAGIGTVPAGEPFTVDARTARRLLAQSDLYKKTGRRTSDDTDTDHDKGDD